DPSAPASPPDASVLPDPSRAPQAPSSPGPRPRRTVLATFLAGVVAIVGTMALAVDWAHDQPRTIAFTLADDPFGDRSLLHPEQARAAVDGMLDRLKDDEGVTSLFLEPVVISMLVVDRSGLRRSLRQYVGGDVEIREFRTTAEQDRRHPDPVPPDEVRELDLAAALGATRRARARTPGAGLPNLLLAFREGRIAGWEVEVPGDDDTELQLDREGREVDYLGAAPSPATSGVAR
ncbi:MAG: hypothetical protein AB7G37_11265, partial [Solirubrobacteraceae bacterium]